jgi:nicotinamidase/pyrazinamidase
VVFTQDWHPADHCSFGNDGDKDVMTGDHNVVAERWPPHCVQETDGAQIVDGLPIRQTDVIIKKGWEQNVDAYSAFWDCEHRHETECGRGSGARLSRRRLSLFMFMVW